MALGFTSALKAQATERDVLKLVTNYAVPAKDYPRETPY